ncbi:MAG: glucose 1-dehydrogenase [Anaerolineae bacterium]|nr:glucose 1-dehydrogenase [Anaerolineae bacterium]NUQ04783.1 glucose 1-dehydrogenase [Anaerolineae bacterium]
MSIVADRHKGKVAIVTGAGQGIGKGVALRFAQEGAHVVVAEYKAENARQTAEECGAFTRALAYPIDIGDTDQIAQMVREVVAEFGHIDILVNNAGVLETLPLFDLTPEKWDWLQRVNQRGLFFCLQIVAKQMVAQVPNEIKAAGKADRSYGKIVNVSSIAGRSGRPYAAHYSAAKWAAISITQSAAKYLAPFNINVNAVCPGVVPTPMWDDIDRVQAERFGIGPGEWIQKTIDGVPLKRAATPGDLAAAVSFLCSDDADYITGQALNVDGGIEMD